VARVQMKEGDEGLQWSISRAGDKVRHSRVCLAWGGGGNGGAGLCCECSCRQRGSRLWQLEVRIGPAGDKLRQSAGGLPGQGM
jgi:NAD(P)H-hydrate repair Nnr-like enzyme with NAD(P)H-hydrate epimerase domain